MRNIIELSPSTQHQELAQYITEYDQLTLEEHPIEKIFLLQKINHFIETTPPDLELHTWRNLFGSDSLEAQLQYFGITRDGSTLVKNIQFAAAIQRYVPSGPPPGLDYFSALQARDAILKNPNILRLDTETAANYIQYNLIIMNQFSSNPELQKKYARSQYFLSLCYSKIEAIKGVVDQSFPTFQTNPLGADKKNNNKNFTLDVDGEEKQLVLRVEDRDSMANEAILQTYPVSDYFSEEYYTMMLPFKEGYSEVYRPVVLSEYVEKGGLDDYALTLSELSAADITLEIQDKFSLLSDFCIKLMASGHYHPDIKLSNFLTNGDTIKVSDRKTITKQINPKATEIFSTIIFAPPEYCACLNKYQTALNHVKASLTTLNMPRFMSYQIGMALKEFVLTAFAVENLTKDLYLQWISVNAIIKQPTKAQRNLFALIQELTRSNPQDRLSIENFQTLLTMVHLPHNAFLVELEAVSPLSQLSHAPEIAVIHQIIDTPVLTPALQQKWDELEQTGIALEIYSDPRTRFLEKACREIKIYLNKIDELVASSNRKKASSLRLVGSFLGVALPETTKIEEMPALPVMPDKIKRYYDILEAMPSPMLDSSDMEKLRHIQLRQNSMQTTQTIRDSSATSSPLTSSPDESAASSPHNLALDSEATSADSPDLTEFDSGTFIHKPIPTRSRSQQSAPEDAESFDTSTFMHVPLQQSKPSNAEQKTHTKTYRKIVEAFRDEKPAGPQSKNASDIKTTINRGNKF